MKVFICGGGSGQQTVRAVRRLNEVIRHDLPCLYIPLAMEEDHYDSCYEWITGELSRVDIPGIEMIRSAEELARKRLADYSFLFIGGGNTFRLLSEIKRVNMFEPIQEYLQNGGVAFGGSAGAIIFGEDLESCILDDDNTVGLKDTRGFDVLNGISFLCHFTNRISEHDQRSEDYLLKISNHRKTYALPEEDTLFLNENQLEEIVDKPYYIFENGTKIEVSINGGLMQNIINAKMIAPCGLDCGICKRALTGTNPCPGCLGPDENKPEFCRERCGIICCGKRIENGYKYCDECPDYPCADVMEKENRYTSKYPLYESPGKNLRDIRGLGMERFLENEREKFTCKECGHVISVHTGVCSGCGKQYEAQVIQVSGCSDQAPM